jgi:hypothetical protein|tara:strand:- start:12975 stop:13124 length:150 start_codon:yes stop_codon:yes gene_type:complete
MTIPPISGLQNAAEAAFNPQQSWHGLQILSSEGPWLSHYLGFLSIKIWK